MLQDHPRFLSYFSLVVDPQRNASELNTINIITRYLKISSSPTYMNGALVDQFTLHSLVIFDVSSYGRRICMRLYLNKKNNLLPDKRPPFAKKYFALCKPFKVKKCTVLNTQQWLSLCLQIETERKSRSSFCTAAINSSSLKMLFCVLIIAEQCEPWIWLCAHGICCAT